MEAFVRGTEEEAFGWMMMEDDGTEESAARREAAIRRLQGGLDPERGPLVNAGLFRAPDGDHLLLVIHHLVVDGVSWRILLEDLATACRQAAAGEPIALPEKTHAYRDWARALEELAARHNWAKERAYWSRVCAGRSLPLPRGGFVASRKAGECLTRHIEWSKETTADLLNAANRAYGTEAGDLLLSAFVLAVLDWSGERGRLLIQLEGHGREELTAGLDVTRTVGWFTSIYPVAFELPDPDDLGASIKTVKETLRQVPDKGVRYGILRYMTEDAGGLPPVRPEISFNYLGQFDGESDTGWFTLSPLSVGMTVSPESEQPHPLEVTGMVEGERLVFTISHHPEEFSILSVDGLAERFRQRLLEVVGHCMARETRELTPSDVGAADLSPEEFELITRFYGQGGE